MSLQTALVEFVDANAGCSLKMIQNALASVFPSVHFETYLEVNGPKLVSRVQVLVPKTEARPSRLVTLYFPRGTMLGLS